MMKILHINTSDTKGGAAMVAWRIHKSFIDLDGASFMAVKYKFSTDENVYVLDNDLYRNKWFVFFKKCSVKASGLSWRLSRLFDVIANPKYHYYKNSGKEYFDYNALKEVITKVKPHIIHAHVLHGEYIDLRYLASISGTIPVVITLHDAWLLSGHCAHSFSCTKWISGCGSCPDLTIRPAIKKDATHFNWNQKNNIYKNAQFAIVTPCQWLMQKVEKSMLLQAAIEQKVIHNGIDLKQFSPNFKKEARAKIGIKENTRVLLFASNGIKNNIWKDFKTLQQAIQHIATQTSDEITLIAIGEKLTDCTYKNCTIHFKEFIPENQIMHYYQAADIYVHSANADTFPTTILEALSSGIPVIASAICGITEQVKGLQNSVLQNNHYNTFPSEVATGILVPPQDFLSLASAILHLHNNQSLIDKLSKNARNDAQERFNLQDQVKRYVELYNSLLKK